MEKREIKVKQHDITDCGRLVWHPFVLTMDYVFPFHVSGSMLSQIKKERMCLGLPAAHKLGLSAKGVRGLPRLWISYPNRGCPCYCQEQLQHYVVVYKVTKTHVTLYGSGDGRMHQKRVRSSITSGQRLWLLWSLKSLSGVGTRRRASSLNSFAFACAT